MAKVIILFSLLAVTIDAIQKPGSNEGKEIQLFNSNKYQDTMGICFMMFEGIN